MVASGQRAARIRRIGVPLNFDENDLEGNLYLSALAQGLAEFGWIEGRNLRMDVRWAAANIDRARRFAK